MITGCYLRVVKVLSYWLKNGQNIAVNGTEVGIILSGLSRICEIGLFNPEVSSLDSIKANKMVIIMNNWPQQLSVIAVQLQLIEDGE